MRWLPLVVLLCSQITSADNSRTLRPAYTPPSQTDSIRIWGHPELGDVVELWRNAYVKDHPDIRVELKLTGSDVAMAGLYTGQADLALLGRDATSSEIQAFEWVYQYKPTSVEILNGSVATPGRSAALSVLVHESNPLDSLRLSQLEALFGYAPEGAATSIRTWGELGPEGNWSDSPVQLYTLDTETGTGRFFRRMAVGGTRHLDWSRVREFEAETSDSENASAIANRALLNALKLDPFGLAVAMADGQVPGIRPVPLRACDDCEPVLASPESIADHSYPLARRVNAYFNQPAGQAVDPVLASLLAFILGPGQSLVGANSGYVALASPESADDLVTVRLSVDEQPIVPILAESLGYFRDAGLNVIQTDAEEYASEDFRMQIPLLDGQVDAAYHWFHHAVFGARHNLPLKAVMVFNDAPGMTVLVASRLESDIRSAADFKGRKVAEGAGYGTKSLLTNYLARRAGLSAHSYTPVMTASDGRESAVMQGLERGDVDVMTFQEPLTSMLLETGLVATLYDFTNGASTARNLGASWPAQSLLMAPDYIEAHPDTVKRLVSAFVRTMRFINSHTASEIAAALPSSYLAGKDDADRIAFIERTLPAYAKGDYSFSGAAVELILDSISTFDFDSSQQGRWRATCVTCEIQMQKLYDNRFVVAAMEDFK